MTAEPRSLPTDVTTPRLSRRTLLRRAAVLGVSGSALAAFLGACGTVTTATEVAPTVNAAASIAATAASSSGAAPTAAAIATQAATSVPGGLVATA